MMRMMVYHKMYYVFLMFAIQFMGNILVEGFSHKPFLVERFKRFDDDNAEIHTSENIQHCLGLFLRFCKRKPDCIGFSISKSNRKCRLSDFSENWSITDDDGYDSYKKISDNELNSPAGAAGSGSPAPISAAVASRKAIKTDPISKSRNYCSDSYPYAYASGSYCCNTKRTHDNSIMSRNSPNCRNDRHTSCSSCFSKAKYWNMVPDETYVVPYA